MSIFLKKIRNKIFSNILQNQTDIFNNQKNIIENINQIKEKLDNIEFSYKKMFYAADKRSGENLLETKIRIFRSMEVEDDFMMIKQRGNLILLKYLIKTCNENRIDYWAEFGTMLGAYRHSGFIPWDDDVDIAMKYSDIDNLEKIVNSSDFFRLVSFHNGCWNLIYRLVFKEDMNLWWVDIYPLFEPNCDIVVAHSSYCKYRKLMINELKSHCCSILNFDYYTIGKKIVQIFPHINIKNNFLEKEEVDREFKIRDKYNKAFFEEISCKPQNKNGFICNINDEVSVNRNYNGGTDETCGYGGFKSYSKIYPLLKVNFFDIEINLPNCYLDDLKTYYGDYLSIPSFESIKFRTHSNLIMSLEDLKNKDLFLSQIPKLK